MVFLVPVYVRSGGKTVFRNAIDPSNVVVRPRRRNYRTLADEVLESGPETALPPRFARRITEPTERPLNWYEMRYPSSWRDCSWKRQTGKRAQHLRHH